MRATFMPFFTPLAERTRAILFILSLKARQVISVRLLLTGLTSTKAIPSGYILAFLATKSMTVIMTSSRSVQ